MYAPGYSCDHASLIMSAPAGMCDQNIHNQPLTVQLLLKLSRILHKSCYKHASCRPSTVNCKQLYLLQWRSEAYHTLHKSCDRLSSRRCNMYSCTIACSSSARGILEPAMQANIVAAQMHLSVPDCTVVRVNALQFGVPTYCAGRCCCP